MWSCKNKELPPQRLPIALSFLIASAFARYMDGRAHCASEDTSRREPEEYFRRVKFRWKDSRPETGDNAQRTLLTRRTQGLPRAAAQNLLSSRANHDTQLQNFRMSGEKLNGHPTCRYEN
jgi:hypothetical protein